MRKLAVALALASTALCAGPAAASAQEDGVVVDPDSPAAKEYAIPLEAERNRADPGPTRRAGQAGRFGEGISGGEAAEGESGGSKGSKDQGEKSGEADREEATVAPMDGGSGGGGGRFRRRGRGRLRRAPDGRHPARGPPDRGRCRAHEPERGHGRHLGDRVRTAPGGPTLSVGMRFRLAPIAAAAICLACPLSAAAQQPPQPDSGFFGVQGWSHPEDSRAREPRAGGNRQRPGGLQPGHHAGRRGGPPLGRARPPGHRRGREGHRAAAGALLRPLRGRPASRPPPTLAPGAARMGALGRGGRDALRLGRELLARQSRRCPTCRCAPGRCGTSPTCAGTGRAPTRGPTSRSCAARAARSDTWTPPPPWCSPASRTRSSGIRILPYFRALYRQPGFRRLFDVVAFHPYARTVARLEREIRSVRAIMRRRGDLGRPTWITEIGWATNGPERSRFRVSVEAQATRLRGAYRAVHRARASAGASSACTGSRCATATCCDWEHDWFGPHTGLFYRSGYAKPAWLELARVAGGSADDWLGGRGATPAAGGRLRVADRVRLARATYSSRTTRRLLTKIGRPSFGGCARTPDTVKQTGSAIA